MTTMITTHSKLAKRQLINIAAATAIILLAVNFASAQSLGDVARANKKNKAGQASSSQRFDNDNLPTNQTLSVVGPAPVADATPSQVAKAEPAADTSAADMQKKADDWKKKIDDQKAKLDSLVKDLDLNQREYRLREAALYSDAGQRLRNQGEWDKEDRQAKSEIETKQKAIDDARQQLDEMQEQAHKAGVQKQSDSDSDKPKQ